MVARLSQTKGIDRAIKAISYCIKKDHNVKLHIVGGGSLKESLQELAKSEGVEKSVIFYGEQANPYRYMKNADLLLMASYHEAAPMVFGESIVLNVPILTTNTCSAVELVKDRNVGIVVDNSQEGIKAGVQKILDDPSVLDEIIISADQINKHANQQVDAMVALARATFGDFK
jgi:glycosyltransferase involved in cell wall biosynthesis